MSQRVVLPFYLTIVATVLTLILHVPLAFSQHGSEGRVTVTVLDPSGSVVPAAHLELRDLSTNDARAADTEDRGIHTFVNLSLGRYKLTVTKPGFQTQVYNDVIVQAAQTTDLAVTLRVGAVNDTVEVNGGTAPLIETTTNSIGTTVDMKQIEDLPIQGRDIAQLSQLIPGYTGGQSNEGGTWNGLPSIDQGNSIDGIIGSASRMKFGGNSQPAVSPRLESIAEMTVQTEQLDMNQGFGQASMQINFVTRRGTNRFHGRIFDDFRNAALNANSWTNDALTALDPSNPQKKNPIKLNDFGGSVGGPILRNKLFFFGTFAESRRPGTSQYNNWLFTPAAQSGIFTWIDQTTGATNTQDLFQWAASHGVTSNNVESPATAAVFSAYPASNLGSITPAVNGDPNVNRIDWQVSNPTIFYYPAVRVDFTPNDRMRFNVAWNMTKSTTPSTNAPDFPGSTWAKTGAGNTSKNYSSSFGFDWTLSPNVVNEFRGGYLYNASLFSYNAAPVDINVPQVAWAYPGAGGQRSTQMSGTVDWLLVGTFYPLLNASDTLSWQKKAHSFNFGFSWYQEQDHYYNAVQGFPVVTLGLVTGDPATNAIGSIPGLTGSQRAQAQQLYAILTGRISGINGEYAYDPKRKTYANSPPELSGYNLDELQRAWALHFQDSYRVRPNLTLNYGLRWDFTGPDHDLTGGYHNADPAAMFGPSGIYNLFNPGSFKGDPNPQIAQRPRPFNSWNVSPQPALGFAWNPHGDNGFLGKIMGGDRTVIRAGASLKKFTEPQQYFWNQASDIGAFFYQFFNLFSNNTGSPNSFAPGSYILNSPFLFNNKAPLQLPANKSYLLSPQTYLKSEAESDFTFAGGPGANGIDPNIKQPYVESWNFGIQRQLGDTRALELRYVGNRTLRQWMYQDINEVNIFQSGSFGVLTNVKAAQKNLAANNASGNPNYQGSFANHGLAGQQATPLFDAAFAGEAPGVDGSLADYTDFNFSTMVGMGEAGSIAGRLTNNNGTAQYFCNLMADASGSNPFGPCTNSLNGVNWAGGPGPGLPSNFFQANPFESGNGALFLVAQGYSNYNAMQVDFRQRQWHGLQFDANYTWGKTLGISSPNNWQGQTYTFSLRSPRLGYGPALFDIRHSLNINGTIDLPFGHGKAFLSQNKVLDKVVGGWTIGTIFNFQTGTPFLLGGGSGNGDPFTASTFNNNPNADGLGDGGVVLHGVTLSQLQSAVGVHRIPGSTQVALIDPKYLAVSSGPNTGGGANPTYITPNTTPGTIGQRVWLYGPKYWNDDVSITKHFPIRESLNFTFQAEMLNVFNHPNFQQGPGSGCNYYCTSAGYQFPFIQGSGFGIGGISPNYNLDSPNQGARVIELRANIEF
jgi:hypothetical protein